MYEHIYPIDVIISQTIAVIGSKLANFMTLIVFLFITRNEAGAQELKTGHFF
ncbi:hypothetical protein [Enterobacter hormaechei]|uniref:hypothetical protein n=1 Tax=Enterobacter hormaechei TaxID=158836 RepID=UPI00020CECFE|nr:hypothetical protein [Enterobacter hormaechei]EGK57962.1 hypothetical protein HMPREF9086_3953 [Enterobacter hormaechei ATCC 49162]